MGAGGVGLGGNSGPLLWDEHLKDFPALVYGLLGAEGSADSASMTGCQDQFNSHNGRKGRLTSVIFSNMLLIGTAQAFPLWMALCGMLNLCRGCWIVVHCFKTLVEVHCSYLLPQNYCSKCSMQERTRTMVACSVLMNTELHAIQMQCFLLLVNNQPNL